MQIGNRCHFGVIEVNPLRPAYRGLEGTWQAKVFRAWNTEPEMVKRAILNLQLCKEIIYIKKDLKK